MSVLPMKRVTIAALKKNRKQILEFLQHRGVMEIRSMLSDDEVFSRQDQTQAVTRFRKNNLICEQALSVLDEHAPAAKGLLSSLEGKTILNGNTYETAGKAMEDSLRVAGEILDLQKEYEEARAMIPRAELQQLALKPWMQYDLPTDFAGTRSTAVFVGTVPGEATRESILEVLNESAPDTEAREVEIISSDADQTCIFVVCTKKAEPEITAALRKLNFAKAPVSTTMSPAEEMEKLEKELTELRNKADKLQSDIIARAEKRADIQKTADYFSLRADKYETLGQLFQSNRTFLVEGYVPAKDAGDLEKELVDRFDVVFESEDPAEDEDVPVKLSNNGFAAPLESVVESYSLPGRGELDPTFLMSLFYYFLFGMMLSDAGYGFVMTAVCIFALAKFKGMDEGMRKTLTMFRNCGISTMFWGVMFGSYFGDALSVFTSTFLGKEITIPPLWFEPVKDPMRMLVFCFVVALIHLFTGLGAKMYLSIKNGDIKGAIYDGVFWYMLVGGCIFLLLTMQMCASMMGISPLGEPFGTIGKVLAIAGAVGIIFTGGRESKNWFKRILKGLYAVYGISSWLSDVLSYSRLLALGLATGVIASVFNKMGSMGGRNIFGLILFILVFLIGQTINILINLLGAYVHTNRLQFVEFFGKFYEGGGKKFAPFGEKTKYFNFKEEN